MKKFFETLLLVLCLAPALGAVAYADVPALPEVAVKGSAAPVLLIALAVIACAVLIYVLRKRRGK